MKKIDDLILKWLGYAIAALLFSMMVIIFVQVLARYAFSNSLLWSEEAGRFHFVWITFFGLVVAYKKGAHVALDLLPNYLTGINQKVLKLINCLLIVALAAAFFTSGLELVELGSGQESPAMELPMDLIYSVIPISGALMFYFSVRELWNQINTKAGDE